MPIRDLEFPRMLEEYAAGLRALHEELRRSEQTEFSGAVTGMRKFFPWWLYHGRGFCCFHGRAYAFHSLQTAACSPN